MRTSAVWRVSFSVVRTGRLRVTDVITRGADAAESDPGSIRFASELSSVACRTEADSGGGIERFARKSQPSKLLLSGRIKSASMVVSSMKGEKLAMKGAALMLSANHGAANTGFAR